MQEGGRERGALVLAGCVTLLVVAVQLLWIHKLTYCGTPDACTYLALGESLSQHHGFTENFLYQYQFVSAQVPTHGIEYWRPGTSFFLLLAHPFGGVTLHSGAVVSVLAGLLLALAAWRIALDLSRSRWLACACYLLCLVLPPLWGSGLSADSTLFYGAFTAWFLALFRVSFRSCREDALALLCIAMVSLIRNDALLLFLPLAAVFALRRMKGEGGSGAGYAALLLLGFLLANAPVPLLNHAVLGKAFPSGTLGAMYLSGLADLLIYGEPVSMRTLLSHGVAALVKARVTALPTILYRIVFLLVGFAAVFVPVLCLRREDGARARVPELAGGAVFLATVALVYGLVLPAVGVFSALRSFTGLLPLTAVLIVCGIRWACRGGPAVARRVFAAVWAFYAVTGVTGSHRTLQEMNQGGDRLRGIAAALAQHGGVPGGGAGRTLVMTTDAAQFSTTTGYAAVPVPANGSSGLRAAARDFKPRFIVLKEDEFAARQADLNQALGPAAVEHLPALQAVLVSLPAAEGR